MELSAAWGWGTELSCGHVGGPLTPTENVLMASLGHGGTEVDPRLGATCWVFLQGMKMFWNQIQVVAAQCHRTVDSKMVHFT